MTGIQQAMMDKVAGIHLAPGGAYNFRINGASAGRASSPNISILSKEDGSGIDIHVRPGTKGETVYIPVVVSQSGLLDTVQNDFFIGDGADVKIVAGCGIHNDGADCARHDGIHIFHLGRDSRVLYEEKHFGAGDGTGDRVLNPVTDIIMDPGSHMEMDTVQIEGVDSTKRVTRAIVGDDCTLIVREKLMTHGSQYAETGFDVDLCGEGASANVVSRSVAKGASKQVFLSKINGNCRCMGHSECDAIIMDTACVQAIPEITANHVDASLIHEAAIGKIAGEQIIKLMTLGLTQEEAEAQIVNGFLK